MMGAFRGLWPIPAPAISPAARRYRDGQWQPAPFRHSGTRGRWVHMSAGLMLLVCLCGLIVTAEGFDLATRVNAGETITATSLDSWADTVNVLVGWYIIAGTALLVSLLAWLYRAVQNLPALAGGFPSRSPRESVGWWFVPVVDLVLPYRVVKEAWERYAVPSRNGGNTRLLAWWICLVVGGTLFLLAASWGSRAAMIAALTSDPDGTRLRIVAITSTLILLGAASVLTMYLVREIQARGQLRAAALGYNVPRYWQPAMGTWMAPGGAIPAIPSIPTVSSAPAVPAGQPVFATPAGSGYGALPGQPASWSPPVVPTTAWPWAPPPPPARPGESFAPPPAPAVQPVVPDPVAEELSATDAGLTAVPGTCTCGAVYPAGVRFCAACGLALA